MSTGTRIGCLALTLWIGASVMEAQQQPRVGATQASPTYYTVSGTVADRAGTPIFGAEVSLIEGDSAVRRVRSDSMGRFQLTELTSMELILRVRHLGYEPTTLAVHVTKAGRTASILVTLDPNVANLAPVVIEDDEPAERADPRMMAFRDRVATNSFGHYVTEAMLAQQRPQHASDVLRGLPGVSVRAANRRIGNIVRLRGCGVAGQSAERGGPLVWLDGVRLVGAEIDEVTAGMDIAGMEVYNSFAGVPAQYFDRSAVCGTILVWTKR